MPGVSLLGQLKRRVPPIGWAALFCLTAHTVCRQALCRAANCRAFKFLGLDDEVEAAKASVTRLLHVEKERLVEKPIPCVSGFARKVKLGGQDTTGGRLNLEMEVPRAAGIERRYDGVEPPAPLVVSKLMTAEPETSAVVIAVLVRLPDLNEASWQGAAPVVEDETRNRDTFTAWSVKIEIPFIG